MVHFQAVIPWLNYLLRGTGMTVFLAIMSAIFGLVIAILVNYLRHKRRFSRVLFAYIDLFRGTPILLQLSMMYYALPRLLGGLINTAFSLDVSFQLSPLQAAIITFSLNSGAYVSEIIRAGMASIPRGEIEAAESLGVSKWHIFKDILMPVGLRNSFPSLINELITLVKESSIVSLIGLLDLMRRQQIVTAQTFLYFEPLLIVGIVYYTLVKLISLLGRLVEKRWLYAYRA